MGFLSMLVVKYTLAMYKCWLNIFDIFAIYSLGTLGASLLGNILTDKGVIRPGDGTSWSGFLMPPHPLTNFEI